MTEPKTLIITDSEKQDAGARQCPDEGKSAGEGKLLPRVPIYLFHEGKRVIEPLNAPARNEVMRKNPALVKHVVAKALQRRANKEGRYEDTDCVVHWKPSVIPFHIEFEISVSNDTCQHLVSIRKIKEEDLVSARLHNLLTSLTETAPIRKEHCLTCKGFLKQAISKSSEQ